jgi:hypothetical protein
MSSEATNLFRLVHKNVLIMLKNGLYSLLQPLVNAPECGEWTAIPLALF